MSRLLAANCRGFTLVELLVVIAIISMVTIATVPMILPALDTRRIREASRIVSTHFASAQSEALAKGRPVGVWIDRLAGEKTAAMDLFLCEVPAPYAGDSLDSRVIIHQDTSVAGVPRFYFEFPSTDTSWIGFPLRPGDLIRFNYRGPWFRLTGDTASKEYQNQLTQDDMLINNTVPTDAQNLKYIKQSTMTPYKMAFDRIRTSTVAGAAGTPFNNADYQDCQFPAANASLPYQIYRQPVKSAASPVQMPGGAVLDLYYSGMTSSDYFGNSVSSLTSPILVMFDKTGSLESLYWDGKRYPITGPLYFLVGKRNKLPHVTYSRTDPPETQSEKHNFRDLENIWVSINPQTGLVTTAEVASFDDSFISSGSEAALLQAALPQSRAFATSAQTMGGR